ESDVRAALRGSLAGNRRAGRSGTGQHVEPLEADFAMPSRSMPGSKAFDLDAPETNRIVVSGKSKMAAGAVFARVRMVRHELGDAGHIGVGDHRAVQFHFDSRAFDRDLLEIPFTCGP